jgi:uncharacterized protein
MMFEFLSQPWPWYIGGPVIGLILFLMLYFTNKPLGVSSSMRHACAACVPGDIKFFKYDWKKTGIWNLVFVLGISIGGFLGGYIFAAPEPIALSDATRTDLEELGITDFNGYVPSDLFNLGSLFTLPGFIIMVGGGFLIGFGARYAGGCTSGHAMSGISNLQTASVVAVGGFFVGGLFITHLILPMLL